MIEYFIISLMTKERSVIVNNNISKFPQFKIYPAINGYDINETIDAFKKSKLAYKYLSFDTYGTLANFLTKYSLLQYQIQNNIQYVCFIEDDLEIYNDFFYKVEQLVNELADNQSINMVRLGKWGEGYITSCDGAKRIVKHIEHNGIIENIDNQLRLNCGKEVVAQHVPWKLLVGTNKGDCLKTKKINIKYLIQSS